MKREEILATLIRIAQETMSELVVEEIDLNQSYRDLGIDSLDLIDILTAAMKEFKIKIPTGELAQVNTFNGLADVFVKAAARDRA